MGAVGVAAAISGVLGYQYSQTGPVAVSGTAPVSGSAAATCAALHAALPATLDGRGRRALTPSSPATAAAWGSPAIVLRCGVAKPGVITPGSDDYAPLTANGILIQGVAWVAEEADGGYRFTTTERGVRVEVFVPTDGPHDPTSALHASDPLFDLAAPVIATDPRTDGATGPDPEDATGLGGTQ